MSALVSKGMRIENIVLNAGVLKYPNVGVVPFLCKAGKLTHFTESYRNVRGDSHMPMLRSLTESFDRSFSDFALHLHTNTIGPVLVAQKLLKISSAAPPSRLIFISSDSGSTTLFRNHEDGFGAYGASKAALNQMLRHMAAELKRKGDKWDEVCVLAMHPGEVQT